MITHKMRDTFHWLGLLLVGLAAAVIFLFIISTTCGCTHMDKQQKLWIEDQANRSSAFVTLIDVGKTTREDEQDFIRAMNVAWALWKDKIDNGYAAPNWLIEAEASFAVKDPPPTGDMP